MEQVADLHRAYGLESTDGRYLAFCPYHADYQHPALGVFRNGVYCFACGTHRAAAAFLGEYPPGTIRIVGGSAGARRQCRGPRYLPASLAAAYAALLAGRLRPRRDWLYARGLHDDTIERYQLGHSGAAFAIPVFGPDARSLRAVRFRRDHGLCDAACGEPFCDGLVCPKYWGLAGHNGATLYDPRGVIGSQELFLAEGELDTLLLVQHDLPAVTFTNGVGGLKRQHMPLFDRARRVYLCLDQDAAGQARTARLASWFGGRAVWVRWSGAKDVTDLITGQGFSAFQEAVHARVGLHERGATPPLPRATAACS